MYYPSEGPSSCVGGISIRGACILHVHVHMHTRGYAYHLCICIPPAQIIGRCTRVTVVGAEGDSRPARDWPIDVAHRWATRAIEARVGSIARGRDTVDRATIDRSIARAHGGADDARADDDDDDDGWECVASHSRGAHGGATATVRARDDERGGGGGGELVPVAHAALRRWDDGEARTASGGASRGGAARV